MRSTHKFKCNKTGKGLINSIINRLPIEAHVPGYQFCGPGTKLKKRLARGDKGINPLDVACREHDIAYSESNDLKQRHAADKILENRAWGRVKANDSSIKEKVVAYAVTNAMKAKRKIGMGIKREIGMVSKTKTKRKGKQRKIFKKKNKERIIQVPQQSGGVLPLLPILSALGSLASGASSLYNTIKNSKKQGHGLYLNPQPGRGLNINKKGLVIKKKKTIKKKKN